jgi:hypothetical protein
MEGKTLEGKVISLDIQPNHTGIVIDVAQDGGPINEESFIFPMRLDGSLLGETIRYTIENGGTYDSKTHKITLTSLPQHKEKQTNCSYTTLIAGYNPDAD